MTEEQIQAYMEGFLLPMAEDFAGRLEEAGYTHRLTIADDPTPGLAIAMPETGEEIFATFIDAYDEEGAKRTLLRLSQTDYDEEGNALSASRWAIPYDFAEDAKTLRVLFSIFLSGSWKEVMPPAPEDDEGSPAEPDNRVFAVLPRLYTLSDYLEEEDCMQTGVVTARIPFIQMMEGDFILTLTYQRTADENVFLFGIRADLPTEESADEESLNALCEEYNELHSFVKAAVSEKPFPIYEGEMEEARCITLYSCIPEFGGMPTLDDYAFWISLFTEAAEDLYVD